MDEAGQPVEKKADGRPVRVLLWLLSLVVLGLVLAGSLLQKDSRIFPAGQGPVVFTITLLAALLYWAVATFALLPRVAQPAVRDLYIALLLTATAVAIGDAGPLQQNRHFVLPVSFFLSLSLLPVFFLRFSLYFPRTLPWLARRPGRLRPAFLLAAVIAGWNTVHWATHGGSQHPRSPLCWSGPALDALLFAGILGGILCLYLNGRGATLARQKRQVKWVLWGIAIGATPYVVGRVLPRLLFGWDSPVSPGFDRLVEMAIPLALMFSIVRDRFFDIDVIIRRSVLYTLLALGLALGFALLLFPVGRAASSLLDLPDTWVAALSAGIAVAAFVPLRRIIGRWVDRTFFNIRYQHEQDLAALRSDLAPAATEREIGDHLCAFLLDALHPKRSAVVVRTAAGLGSCGDLEAEVANSAPAQLAFLEPELGNVLIQPGTTTLPERETELFPAALADAGVRLAQPLARDGTLYGLLLLGEKQSGRRYVEEDLQLLSASGLLGTRTLERMTLARKAAEESMAHKALQDLATQKAEFFARVAHDLRTPLTAIHWSLSNLLEGLAGPLNEKQSQYLISVGAAERQLGRLVENIVDLSRMDLQSRPPDPVPVDLRALVHEAATAMAPLAEAHGIHLAPEDSTVDVGLFEREGHVVLTVRDRGPGLPHEGDGDLFELFHQGPASPHRTTKGFGIGLHIVRTWTNSMGGTISAADHAGGGALFTCCLPLWPDEEVQR